ncbi:MAG TPA: ABC transporter permease [Firmicutes bacterium]|nr:ABC transporter permease [Bacillota bacterium]
MEKAVAETNRINGRKFNLDLNKYGIPIAFVIMMIVLTFLSDRFLTLNNIRNVLRQSSILFIVACGQTLVLLTSGIDLSQGSVISLVSMTTALSLCKYGLVPGVIIGILTGLACGSVTGLLVGKAKLLPFVASLAMQYIADGLALISNNGLPVTNIPGNVINKFFVIGGGYVGWFPVPLIIAIVVFLILYFVLKKTKLGRYIYAVGGNKEAARLSGINVDRIQIIVFALSGLLSALASIVLTARMVSGQPIVGQEYSMQSLGATVIGGTLLTGGKGGVTNTIFGVLFIGFMTNGLNILGISTFVQRVLIGAVIIISVYMTSIKKKRS